MIDWPRITNELNEMTTYCNEIGMFISSIEGMELIDSEFNAMSGELNRKYAYKGKTYTITIKNDQSDIT